MEEECPMVYKTIDLFAGIGGIRRGFEMTGYFQNILSAEIDRFACITYKHLFGDDPFNDVTSIEFKEKVRSSPYDVLLAGFPCQAFSIAGKKEGFKDITRGTLFYDIADILDMTRPKAFLLENVEGLVRHEKGVTFKIILETLVEDLNYKVVGVDKNPITGYLEYNVNDFIVNSRNFGVPQNRPRVYIMGFDANRYSSHLDWLNSIQLPKQREGNPIYRDLHDLLEYGAEAEYYLSEGYLGSLKKHKKRHENKGNGYGYIVVNERGIERPISNAILATGGSGKERNLVFDPQDNIGGLQLPARQTGLNYDGIRVMKPSEWGKLQGFIGYGFVQEGVDHFSFPLEISKAQQYKQFGNSVTIPVIEVMAKEMVTILNRLEAELNHQSNHLLAVNI